MSLPVGILFGAWMALCLAVALFYLLSRNASLKRKLHPVIVIGVGVVFVLLLLASALTSDTAAGMLLLGVPAIVAITLLNLRLVKFCDACGLTVQTSNPFRPTKFCPHCGGPLEQPGHGPP